MKTHTIKTINPYFTDFWENGKNFEVRKNDQNYKVGDFVVQKEYDQKNDIYSGREIHGEISYVLSDYVYVQDGFVVFSMINLKKMNGSILVENEMKPFNSNTLLIDFPNLDARALNVLRQIDYSGDFRDLKFSSFDELNISKIKAVRNCGKLTAKRIEKAFASAGVKIVGKR